MDPDVILAGSGREHGFLSRAKPRDVGGVVAPATPPAGRHAREHLAPRTGVMSRRHHTGRLTFPGAPDLFP